MSRRGDRSGKAMAMVVLSVSVGVAAAAPAMDIECAPPIAGHTFTRVDAAQLGFDATALDAAIDFGTSLLSTSVRVYRHGCLAATSDLDPISERAPQFMASATKTVLALVTGRAITLGYLGLDDPIGVYLPEADAAHGAITVRQLLNQTSGLEVSVGSEVAGIATDSVAQTLILPFVAEPGTTFAYAQNTLATLARVVERATGVEFQRFAQDELMARIGIPRDHWIWRIAAGTRSRPAVCSCGPTKRGGSASSCATTGSGTANP